MIALAIRWECGRCTSQYDDPTAAQQCCTPGHEEGNGL